MRLLARRITTKGVPQTQWTSEGRADWHHAAPSRGWPQGPVWTWWTKWLIDWLIVWLIVRLMCFVLHNDVSRHVTLYTHGSFRLWPSPSPSPLMTMTMTITLTIPIILRVVETPWPYNQVSSVSSVLHWPQGLAELQACPLPNSDVDILSAAPPCYKHDYLNIPH